MNCSSQTWDVKISGTVKEASGEPAARMPIVLLENLDTIVLHLTNDRGEFSFDISITSMNDYFLFMDIPYQNSRRDWIKLHAKGDTNDVTEYHLELSKLPIIKDRFDSSIYYELNEEKKYENFDLDYFKLMLLEYPNMCIQFVQTINPKEKKSVAFRRKKHFLKVLNSSGLNMDQIIFEKDIFILDSSNLKDNRSRIEGIVYSMDGNCK